MARTGVILGLLDTSADIADAALACRARELTIAWSRFKYFGSILEDRSIDTILARALERGARFCLIQAYGHILDEVWVPSSAGGDVMAALHDWAAARDFLVTGPILRRADGALALDRRCLLVDLRRYRDLGRPGFQEPGDETVRRIEGRVIASDAGEIRAVKPDSGQTIAVANDAGGPLIERSLAHGLPVRAFPPEMAAGMVYLQPDDAQRVPALRRLLDAARADGNGGSPLADAAVRHFLEGVRDLSGNLERGVFVWNLESYADVEAPPEGFAPPLGALYTVAAGFKPNRILETHGFDRDTRMVVYDYSRQGLAFRQRLHERWDGEDYPGILRTLFRERPSDQAHYLLWQGATPETVDWGHMEARWREELEAWGGARALRDHWRRFRQIQVDYVHCNLLAGPGPLLPRIGDESSAVIWWSNAFFSVYSNWRYTAAQRQAIYRAWVEALAARAPRLYLYGADSNNISVNFVRAGPYRDWYRGNAGDELEPGKLHRRELRF